MNKRCRTRIFLRVNCILANRDEIDNLKKNRFTYKPKRNVQSNSSPQCYQQKKWSQIANLSYQKHFIHAKNKKKWIKNAETLENLKESNHVH